MVIFEFDSYKDYVRAHVESLPNGGRGEWGRIAKAVGVNSTMVSQIFKGPKDLSIEQALDLCEHYAMPELETEFFISLVQRDRAGTVRLRKRLTEKLEDLKLQSLNVKDRLKIKTEMSEAEKAVFYSDYIYTAVLMLTSVKGTQDAQSISKHLNVPPQRTHKVLDFLVNHELCEHHDGQYKMLPHRSHVAANSMMVSSHHKNWRQKSIEKSEKLSKEELMYTAPISLSKADFLTIREKLVGVIKEATDLIEPSEPETAACLSLDLFYV